LKENYIVIHKHTSPQLLTQKATSKHRHKCACISLKLYNTSIFIDKLQTLWNTTLQYSNIYYTLREIYTILYTKQTLALGYLFQYKISHIHSIFGTHHIYAFFLVFPQSERIGHFSSFNIQSNSQRINQTDSRQAWYIFNVTFHKLFLMISILNEYCTLMPNSNSNTLNENNTTVMQNNFSNNHSVAYDSNQAWFSKQL